MTTINAYNSKRYLDRVTGQLYVWNADTQTWDEEGEPGPTIKTWPLADVLVEGADGGGVVVKNIGDPLNLQDAATKAYVDAQIATMFELFSAVHGAAASDFLFETAGAGEGYGSEGISETRFEWLTEAVGTA